MSLDISIVFCEGPHDAAFIARLLKSKCYKSYNKKINEYPSPIKDVFLSSLRGIEYDSLNVKQLSGTYYAIPNQILKKDNKVVLIYSVGGNRQEVSIHTILDVFMDSSTQYDDDVEAIGVDKENSFKFLFINDADDNLDEEVANINSVLENYLSGWNNLLHNSVMIHDVNKYGIYIFSKDDGKTGKLEDVLMEIMYEGNEEIFDKAAEYIGLKCENRLIRKKVKCENGEPIRDKDEKKQKFYPEKSIITIAGQLQSSGKGQVVTIEDSDYITLNKIQQSEKIQEIINFFEKDIDSIEL